MIMNYNIPLVNGWQKDLPNENGDWMWVDISECGCCIDAIGVVFVTDKEIDPRYSTHKYTDCNGVVRYIHLDKINPPPEKNVTGWKKFESPYSEEHYKL